MTRKEWLQYGIDHNWIATRDPKITPMSIDQKAAMIVRSAARRQSQLNP